MSSPLQNVTNPQKMIFDFFMEIYALDIFLSCKLNCFVKKSIFMAFRMYINKK